VRNILFTLLVCALAACGSGSNEGSTTTTTAAGAPDVFGPTTGADTAARQTPTTVTGATTACSLLTQADVEAATKVTAGPPTPTGSKPRQFESGGTGTVDKCTYKGKGDTKVDVVLVTAQDPADARAAFDAAAKGAMGDVLLQGNNAYLVDGNKFATITEIVDFDAEAPPGVDPSNREEINAFAAQYVQDLLLRLADKAKSRL
jgi:hypothetical protein